MRNSVTWEPIEKEPTNRSNDQTGNHESIYKALWLYFTSKLKFVQSPTQTDKKNIDEL